MSIPLVHLPQAGGIVGLVTASILLICSCSSFAAGFVAAGEGDLWFARKAGQLSLLFIVSAICGPVLFGDWAAIFPIAGITAIGVRYLRT
jgi:hypothetical protein